MKKMLSLLLMLCLTASLIIVHAEPSITVAGELLYSQDFEGTVEGAFTTTNGGHMIYSVIEQDGNHFLYGNANGLYGISGAVWSCCGRFCL